jgi:hypothetical protein
VGTSFLSPAHWQIPIDQYRLRFDIGAENNRLQTHAGGSLLKLKPKSYGSFLSCSIFLHLLLFPLVPSVPLVEFTFTIKLVKNVLVVFLSCCVSRRCGHLQTP